MYLRLPRVSYRQRWALPSTKVSRYFFNTVTGTVSTWYRKPVPRYFFYKVPRYLRLFLALCTASICIANCNNCISIMQHCSCFENDDFIAQLLGSVEVFFLQHCNLFLFFVSIAASKEFLDLQ